MPLHRTYGLIKPLPDAYFQGDTKNMYPIFRCPVCENETELSDEHLKAIATENEYIFCAKCKSTVDKDGNIVKAGDPMRAKNHDPVNHPKHYTQHPSGVECIQVTEHFNFNRGNAIKYIWRADEKGRELEDLKKARWYLDREINKLENERVD